MALATISVLGVDLGKNVCSVVGLDSSGAVVMRRKMRRETLAGLAEKLPACVVAMEACCGAHHLGRLFAAHGHDVRLMSPEYVRPYVKAHKNDDRDAEGIAEAATRPFDALRRTEEPGSARRADASPISRPPGRRADGSDQSAARHSAGARIGGRAGQAEARAVPGRADGRTGRSGIEPADDLARRRRSRAMGLSSIGGSRPSTPNLSLSRKRMKTPADWRPSPGSARSSHLRLSPRSGERRALSAVVISPPGSGWFHGSSPPAANRSCSGSASAATNTFADS